MKKIYIVITLGLILFTPILKGQSTALQQVTGTSVFLEPPQGFTTAKRFAGFQHDATKSSLMVLSLKDVSMADVADQMFSEAQLKKQNMTKIGREDILVNGKMVGLVNLQQQTSAGIAEKVVRLLPGDNELIILNGIYLKAHRNQVYDALRDAIVSAEWRDTPAPKGFDSVDFEFDVAPGWEIREPGNLSRMIMLSLVDAPKHSAPMDWPLVIMVASLDGRSVNSLRTTSIEMLKNVKGFEFKSIQSEQSREINGLKSYFIKSIGTDIETSELLSCWQLLIQGKNNTGYYRMLAIGSDLETDAGQLIEDIMESFTLK